LDQIRASFGPGHGRQGTEERHRVHVRERCGDREKKCRPRRAPRDFSSESDIGTQGVKAAIYDSDGLCLGEATAKSELLHPVPGAVEEDPERQVRSTCEVIAECAAVAAGKGTVRALAIDGQMAGIIGLGDDGRPVTPYDSWLDTRCAPWIECMRARPEPRIVRKARGPPSFNHGPKDPVVEARAPGGVRKRSAPSCKPGGYAAMRLCGL